MTRFSKASDVEDTAKATRERRDADGSEESLCAVKSGAAACRQFFMPMIPPTVTAQMHKVTVKNGKPLFYDPPEVVTARSILQSHLAKFRPEKPFGAGVRLIVKWLFPKGKHKDGEYRTTRPDTDNLQKLLKDCMTVLNFWDDDALVASEIVEKFWADIPGIWIRIEEL